MRLLLLIPFFLLSLSACMTQRDQTVWREFKDEISSDKPAAAASEAAEAVSPPAQAGQ